MLSTLQSEALTEKADRRTNGLLDLNDLDKNYSCIIQLRTQTSGVIHQVMLRPDKIKDGLIRLGETPGDEASGWQYPANIIVLSVLGIGTEEKDKTWTVTDGSE